MSKYSRNIIYTHLDFLLLFRLCLKLKYINKRKRIIPLDCDTTTKAISCCSSLFKTFLTKTFNKKYISKISYSRGRFGIVFNKDVSDVFFKLLNHYNLDITKDIREEYTRINTLLTGGNLNLSNGLITIFCWSSGSLNTQKSSDTEFYKRAKEILSIHNSIYKLIDDALELDKKYEELLVNLIDTKPKIAIDIKPNHSPKEDSIDNAQKQFNIALKKYLERTQEG